MKHSNPLPGLFLRPVRWGERGALEGLPLERPVEVLQDRWGIPHVFAGGERDLMTAQGFLHARDRLWQMESIRRMTAGTLAEAAGPAMLGGDCFSRLIGLDRLRGRALAGVSERTLALLEAYARGVNAWIAAAGARLPLEFRLLGLRPAPWKVEDLAGALAVNAWFLQTNYQEEVLALHLRDRFTQEQWDELFPGWPGSHLPEEDFFRRWRGVRIGAVLPEALAWYPSLASLSPSTSAAATPEPLGEALPGASNNWVAARGEGGAPLLANDPHLGVTVPQVWYLCHLHCPQLNVCGASLPGTPGVAIGRNEHLAWGVTNVMTDCVDLFVVRVDPGRPTRYLHQGVYLEMEEERQRVPAAGGRGRTLTIQRTVHGPVITRLEPGVEAAVCLKWYGTWNGPGFRDTTLEGFFDLCRARGLEEAQAAVERIATVGQNFLLADVRGHIAWLPSGRVPVRSGYSGRLPADGSGSGCDWQGFLPAERIPRLVDPPEGLIATANHRMLPEGWPQAVSHTFCAPYRCDRIELLLRALNTPSEDDFRALQMDVHSPRADHLLPVLSGLPFSEPEAREAAAILAGWDRQVRTDSEGALLFNLFLVEATELLLRPLIGEGVRVVHAVGPYLYNALDRLFERERRGEASPLLAGRSFAGVCGQALSRAMRERRRIGMGAGRVRPPGLRPARWGELHTYRFGHPGARGRLSSWLLSRGRYPADGDGTTVNVSIYNAGAGSTPLERYEAAAIPSLRMVCSLAGIDRTSVMAPLGQSGQPGHPHCDDLIRPWRQGRLVPLPLSREGAERLAERRLVLRPPKSASLSARA